jgi:ribonuclease HI
MPQVTIYCDGACSGNPGPGGWGAVLLYKEHRGELSGGEAATTNNRMELQGAIAALQRLKEPCRVDLYSDSTYLINAFNNNWLVSWQRKGWRKSDGSAVKNPDLWQEIWRLSHTHSISWHWVKGHAENRENERCDELAKAEITRMKNA